MPEVKSGLLKLGIWNDDVLRSISPSYINTYLPVSLLSLMDENSNQFIKPIKNSFVPGVTDGLN